jgi:hypothetical protein
MKDLKFSNALERIVTFEETRRGRREAEDNEFALVYGRLLQARRRVVINGMPPSDDDKAALEAVRQFLLNTRP